MRRALLRSLAPARRGCVSPHVNHEAWPLVVRCSSSTVAGRGSQSSCAGTSSAGNNNVVQELGHSQLPPPSPPLSTWPPTPGNREHSRRSPPPRWSLQQRLASSTSSPRPSPAAGARGGAGAGVLGGGGPGSGDAAAAAAPLAFDDPRVYNAKSLWEIVRASVIFRVCTIEAVTRNIEPLLGVATRVMGEQAVAALMRRTFFAHFCAGEDQDSIRPCIEHLRANGIGGILDYAAEADLDETAGGSGGGGGGGGGGGDSGGAVATKYRGVDSARLYDYESEAACDANAAIFEDCIRAVHNVSPEGFAAIKVTALGNPKLLERVSETLVSARQLFEQFDTDGRGYVERERFRDKYHALFQADEPGEVDRIFAEFNATSFGAAEAGDDFIDYVEWSNALQPESMWNLARKCREKGPFASTVLDKEEIELFDAMVARLAGLADLADKLEVRLMVDAEQTYFQPAIDNLVIRLQREHNREFPTIFNTYQCYLKDSTPRMQNDLERARREGYWFAAKLVRGAYMVAERQRALERGYADPIHDTLEDTHACYHANLSHIMDHMDRSNVLVASHNQASVEFAVAEMKARGIEKDGGGVYFGQLLGMADNLTYSLGHAGYKAYKYVPYGPVHEVMPYLIRRAQENSDLLGGVGVELGLLGKNIKSRLMPGN